jgi:membrane protein YdbS with pleckstrin-like domain
MSETQKQTELRNIEDKLSRRYSRLSKLILLIAILLIICVVIVFIGITSLGYGHDWALLNLESWIIALGVLFVIFIILELIFYSHLSSVKNKRIESKKPKIEFINGKRVIVFTYPKGKEGGIFSKTYIDIDENSVLRLKSLMIPPEELW